MPIGGRHRDHFGLVVTSDHDMYTSEGKLHGVKKRPYFKGKNSGWTARKAGDMYNRVSTGPTAYKLLGQAAGGFVEDDTEVLSSLEDQLELKTPEQMEAFFQIFGFWVGDGSLDYSDKGNIRQVVFCGTKETDLVYLERLFGAAGVKYLRGQKSGAKIYYLTITDPAWMKFFSSEYGCHYARCLEGNNEVSSSAPNDAEMRKHGLKWFPSWVFRLRKRALRLVLDGFHQADGISAGKPVVGAEDGLSARRSKCVFTSSIHFRDQLVRAYFQAGFFSYFTLGYRAGSIRGHINGKDLVATCDAWKVHFGERQVSQTILGAGDVKSYMLPGRPWCVTVDHPDHLIVARRAYRTDPDSPVTKATAPTIVSNCTFEAHKILGRPVTPDEIASKFFNMERRVMSQGLTFYRLRIPRSYFHYEGISAKHFIPQIMQMPQFNAKPEHIERAVMLYERIRDRCAVLNRSNPQSASKAVVYYYLRRRGVLISPVRFGRIVGLSHVILLRLASAISQLFGTTKTVTLV